jgi:hypothetical protein
VHQWRIEGKRRCSAFCACGAGGKQTSLKTQSHLAAAAVYAKPFKAE